MNEFSFSIKKNAVINQVHVRGVHTFISRRWLQDRWVCLCPCIIIIIIIIPAQKNITIIIMKYWHAGEILS